MRLRVRLQLLNGNRFHIETYGCQMNRSDSTDLAALLTEEGFQEASSLTDAQILIINTCAVRDHAEQKVYSRLGAIKKKYGTDFTIIVMGCLAQQESEAIIKKHPYVDFVIGTHQIAEIPSLLKGRKNGLALTDLDEYTFLRPYRERTAPFKALVNISHGCDNYCSYCIVPYVRGRETSRSSGEIVQDIRTLVDQGVMEVMLLGQNVNSYGQESGDVPFLELLEKISLIDGLKRIRFMTPHPKDFDPTTVPRLFGIPKVCPSMHLPLQSASDRILLAMNRKYTFSRYKDIVHAVRAYSDDIFLSTDLLVGFPGETDADFQETLEAVRTLRFDDAYTFKFSKRKFTKAFEMDGNLPEETLSNRLAQIIDLQRAINIEITKNQVGKEVEVLVEEPSQYSPEEFLCRTASGRYVLVPAAGKKMGQLLKVRLNGVRGVTLTGE